ncbi:MAG: hypothetical protein R3Y16_00800, partial [Rikenellaceae bacterium]
MYIFTSNEYKELSERLRESISSLNFYSGVVEFETDNVEIRFIATIMVYFRRDHYPEGEVNTLIDMVPVWWEMHTTTLDGDVINDFDFTTLKEY